MPGNRTPTIACAGLPATVFPPALLAANAAVPAIQSPVTLAAEVKIVGVNPCSRAGRACAHASRH